MFIREESPAVFEGSTGDADAVRATASPLTPVVVGVPERCPETGRRSGLALIDAFPLRRTGTLRLLRASVRVNARAFDCISDLMREVCPKSEPPHAIIICVGGPSPMEPSAIEQVRRVARMFTATPVIILSDRADCEQLVAAFRAGARGYIPTSLEPRLIIEAIRMVLAGGTFLPADTLLRHRRKPQPVIPPAAKPPVGPVETKRAADSKAGAAEDRGAWPPRQLAVLLHLVEGRANKEIARALAMDESAVKSHVRNIMRRLEVINRTQVALSARRLGLLDALQGAVDQDAAGWSAVAERA